MPANMTLRDVPDELHQWLKDQAQIHRRSINREVIVLLDKVRSADRQPKASFQELRQISLDAATLPMRDTRSEAVILGLDATGLPG